MGNTSNLMAGRLLAWNVAWNLAGAVLPLVVALWAIPHLIGGLGKERFGLLAIIWMGVGYFSLFDLGIGAALTKLVAERLGGGRQEEIPGLIVTGQRMMLGLGMVAGLLVVLVTPILVARIFKVPPELHAEATWSFYLLAATIPLVVSAAGSIGVLQAYQRFPAINLVRIPLGLMNFLGPAIVLHFDTSLVATTLVLALSRIAAWIAYNRLCADYRKGGDLNVDKKTAKSLISFGGWITISNLVGPIMVYFDRFLIGALMSLSAVSYYTTPYEVVTRFWVLPEALFGVLFPALTAALASNVSRARQVSVLANRSLMLLMLPPVAIVIMFAHEGLLLWLGEDFAAESAPVLRWLALGVFVNCLARLPYVILQGAGRPDLTAKLHLVELPCYLVALYWAIEHHGVAGAAAVWAFRIFFDTLFLYLLSALKVPSMKKVLKDNLLCTGALVLVLALLSFTTLLFWKLLLAAALILFCTVLGVRELLQIRSVRAAGYS